MTTPAAAVLSCDWHGGTSVLPLVGALYGRFARPYRDVRPSKLRGGWCEASFALRMCFGKI
ncbi:MAG: hypothetical protein L6Q92_06890 [Phycisphaerae bacterium]|nr:hypothetical protein [Phycisphaerae bacterium]